MPKIKKILGNWDVFLSFLFKDPKHFEDVALLLDILYDDSSLVQLDFLEKFLTDANYLTDQAYIENFKRFCDEKFPNISFIPVDNTSKDLARRLLLKDLDFHFSIALAYAIKNNYCAVVTIQPKNLPIWVKLPVLTVNYLTNDLRVDINKQKVEKLEYILAQNAVTLGLYDFRVAKQFSSQQKLSAKARQVYLNTLAVREVNLYCQKLKVETDLEGSYSWDHNLRMLMDVADLVVKNVGRLECRPVLSGEDICQFPLEVWSDRIGYVVVEIDEAAKQVKLLGFVKEVETEELPLSKLPDLEGLVDLLHLAKTKQKLEPLLNQHWDATEKLLVPSGRKIVAKSPPSEIKVSKAKSIKLKERELALIIEMEPESDEKINIIFRVRPLGEIKSLPPGLELALLSPSDKPLTPPKKAKQGDNLLEIKASMQLEKLESLRQRGKLYTVEVKLEDDIHQEKFPSISLSRQAN